MGDSIIYVGSKNMSREDRYYKKDNWGMYKKPRIETKKQKVTRDEKVYKFLTILGRRTTSSKPEGQNNYISELRMKRGKGGPSNKVSRKILSAYYKCCNGASSSAEKEVLIKEKLDSCLTYYGIPDDIRRKLKNQDRAFNSIKKPQSSSQEKKNSKVKTSSTKPDIFYKRLKKMSRKIVPIDKQSERADVLIKSSRTKTISKKTVVAVFNSYYLCCHGITDVEEKNKKIITSLENYLIRNKVDARVRKKVLAIEGIK